MNNPLARALEKEISSEWTAAVDRLFRQARAYAQCPGPADVRAQAGGQLVRAALFLHSLEEDWAPLGQRRLPLPPGSMNRLYGASIEYAKGTMGAGTLIAAALAYAKDFPQE